jgi:uncharacterized damage-inducible protein DinB
MNAEHPTQSVVITPEALLEHWQGHRRLTRKVINAFPEDRLFDFSIGGMRPFADLSMELIRMAAPIARGAATGEWIMYEPPKPEKRSDILRLWDESTEEINSLWSQISPARFQEIDTAFGMWEGPIYSHLFYAIDNEIHHRGQAYVYLRALEIEPPAFYDRSA